MKLYLCPQTCSRVPHILLKELETPCQLQLVRLMKGEGLSPEYLQINPIGAVPVLELDSGQRIREVQVICQYLCDQKPQSQLVATWGDPARYLQLEWLSFISSELHKSFYNLFFTQRLHPDPQVQASIRQHCQERLDRRWGAVAQQLGQSDYLLGSFGIADPYLFTVLGWARMLKMDLSPWPQFESYFQRMSQRPSVLAMLEEEKALG